MSPRLFQLTLAVVAGFSATSTASDPQSVRMQSWPVAAGVSLAGPEFGLEERGLSNKLPGQHGVDYIYNSLATFQRVSQAGFLIVRIPFRWERIQPTLSHPLAPLELRRLTRAVDLAAQNGLLVILDLHNYCRYRFGTPNGVDVAIVDEEKNADSRVTRDDLADLWRRLAIHLRDRPSVLAFGLMNEPHDLRNSSWKEISQHSVDAIRSVDTETWICVAGEQWSNSNRFEELNGPHAWIKDPVRRTVYEAHCYFDFDHSGRYRLSFDDELRLDNELLKRGSQRVTSFLRWLRANNVPGMIGEVGVPVNDGRWRALMQDCSRLAKSHGVPMVIWAAGEWWNDYPLSIQPLLEVGNRNVLTALGIPHFKAGKP